MIDVSLLYIQKSAQVGYNVYSVKMAVKRVRRRLRTGRWFWFQYTKPRHDDLKKCE